MLQSHQQLFTCLGDCFLEACSKSLSRLEKIPEWITLVSSRSIESAMMLPVTLPISSLSIVSLQDHNLKGDIAVSLTLLCQKKKIIHENFRDSTLIMESITTHSDAALMQTITRTKTWQLFLYLSSISHTFTVHRQLLYQLCSDTDTWLKR